VRIRKMAKIGRARLEDAEVNFFNTSEKLDINLLIPMAIFIIDLKTSNAKEMYWLAKEESSSLGKPEIEINKIKREEMRIGNEASKIEIFFRKLFLFSISKRISVEKSKGAEIFLKSFRD
jgi:hypothetical protein